MAKPKKPAPVKVLSDDLLVEVGGEELAVHEGEWVLVHQYMTVGDTKLSHELRQASTELAAIGEDDPDRFEKVDEVSSRYADRLIESVRPRIVAWNWTDDAGNLLPQPGEDPEVFQRLRTEELFWLQAAVKNKTPSAEKNASRPSQTTSSATPRRTRQR